MSDNAKTSQKTKRDLIITTVLLVIFAITLTKNVFFRKKPAAPAASVTAAEAAPSASEQLVVVTNMRLYDKLSQDREALWDREWGRDPFTPQQAMTGLIKAVNMTLKGILWDEKTPKAIVNEKTLLVGDAIYGYTVTEIKPRSVVLKTGEKSIELQVFHSVLNEPPTTG